MDPAQEIDFDNPVPFGPAFPRFVDLVGCSTLDVTSSRTVLVKRLAMLQKFVHAPCFLYPNADAEHLGREYLFKLWNYLLADAVWEDSNRQTEANPQMDIALPFICDMLCSLASRTEFDLLHLLPPSSSSSSSTSGGKGRRLTPAQAADAKAIHAAAVAAGEATGAAPIVASLLSSTDQLQYLRRYRSMLLLTLNLCLRLMHYYYPRHLRSSASSSSVAAMTIASTPPVQPKVPTGLVSPASSSSSSSSTSSSSTPFSNSTSVSVSLSTDSANMAPLALEPSSSTFTSTSHSSPHSEGSHLPHATALRARSHSRVHAPPLLPAPPADTDNADPEPEDASASSSSSSSTGAGGEDSEASTSLDALAKAMSLPASSSSSSSLSTPESDGNGATGVAVTDAVTDAHALEAKFDDVIVSSDPLPREVDPDTGLPLDVINNMDLMAQQGAAGHHGTDAAAEDGNSSSSSSSSSSSTSTSSLLTSSEPAQWVPNVDDDRPEEWAYLDKLCAHVLSVAFFVLPDIVGGPLLLVLTSPLPAADALMKAAAAAAMNGTALGNPRRVYLARGKNGKLFCKPVQQSNSLPSSSSSPSVVSPVPVSGSQFSSGSGSSTLQSSASFSSTSTSSSPSSSLSSSSSSSSPVSSSPSIPLPVAPSWVGPALNDLDRIITQLSRSLRTTSSSSSVSGSSSPSMGPSTPSSSTSSRRSLSSNVIPPLPTYPRCYARPQAEANVFLVENPSLFEWTRPEFFLSSTPPLTRVARTTVPVAPSSAASAPASSSSSSPAIGPASSPSFKGSPSTSNGGAGADVLRGLSSTTEGPRTSSVAVIDSEAPLLLPSAVAVIEAHFSDPEFFFAFAGLWFSHIRRTVQGDAQWSLVPGYWPMVHRFIQTLLLNSRTYPTHPDVLFCQDLILANQPLASHLLSFFVRPVLLTTSALAKDAIDRTLNQLSRWLDRLGLDKNGKDGMTAPLPQSFCHEALVNALLLCIRLDHFQVLLKVETFIYMQLGHFYGQARVEFIERVVLHPRIFLELFLHWCSEVRRVFHYILLYRVRRASNKDAYNLESHAAAAIARIEEEEERGKSGLSTINNALGIAAGWLSGVAGGSGSGAGAGRQDGSASGKGAGAGAGGSSAYGSGSASSGVSGSFSSSSVPAGAKRPNFFSRLTSLFFTSGNEESPSATGKADGERKSGKRASRGAPNELSKDSCVVSHTVLTPPELSIDLMFSAQLEKMLEDLRNQHEFGWSIGTGGVTEPVSSLDLSSSSAVGASSAAAALAKKQRAATKHNARQGSAGSYKMLVVPPRLRPYLKDALREYAEHEIVYKNLQAAAFPAPPSLISSSVNVAARVSGSGPGALAIQGSFSGSGSLGSSSSVSSSSSSSSSSASSSLLLNDVAVGHGFVRLPQLHFTIDVKSTGVPG